MSHFKKYIPDFRTWRPGRILIFSYITAIIIASLILYIPLLSSSGDLSYIDSLFTATSALCVTGLIVVDTGKAFNTGGQIFIMLLLEVGGLGIMTLSTFFFYLLGRGISSKTRTILYSTYTPTPHGEVRSLLKSIIKYALTIEAIGTILLTISWARDFNPIKAFYLAMFHSVSAFTNSGFSLFTDSLMGYKDNYLTNFAFYSLIFLGGLGFLTLLNLSHRGKSGRKPKILLNTRLVLIVSGVLIIGGAIAFALLEYGNTLSGLNLKDIALISLFQSITTRTAGFNSVQISQLTNATLLIFIFLMFIGASPGSCGGGIKTTTLGVLAALIFNRLRGGERVNLMGRTLPSQVVIRAVSILVVGVIVIFTFTFLLMITQLPEVSYGQSKGLFLEYLFEAVSAFGTVGLSMGITGNLNTIGKLLIIMLMIIGRIGPLSMAYAIAKTQTKYQLEYAEEEVMIG